MSGSDAETTSSETIETPDDDSMTPELSSNEMFSLNSMRNLIVNYLPYDYEEEHLEELFVQYGRIVSLKIIRDVHFVSKGYGFVKYATRQEAKAALDALNGYRVSGKILKVSFARFPNKESLDCKILATNFPHDFNEADCLSYFHKYGEIIEYRYVRATKWKINFFVQYNFRHQAEAAVKALRNFLIPGTDRQLILNFVIPKSTHGKVSSSYPRTRPQLAPLDTSVGAYYAPISPMAHPTLLAIQPPSPTSVIIPAYSPYSLNTQYVSQPVFYGQLPVYAQAITPAVYCRASYFDPRFSMHQSPLL